MRYNDSGAIVDDIPLLSQWIKKSKSKDLDFLERITGLEPATDAWKAPMLATTPMVHLAGDDGFEPPRTVLETVRLPLS